MKFPKDREKKDLIEEEKAVKFWNSQRIGKKWKRKRNLFEEEKTITFRKSQDLKLFIQKLIIFTKISK